MGGPSLVWPGADLLMAKAAQRARIPYTLGVAGGASRLSVPASLSLIELGHLTDLVVVATGGVKGGRG